MARFEQLALRVLGRADLSAQEHAAILALCAQPWGAEFAELWATFAGSTHVLALLDGRIVGHALWVTRWLQPDGQAPLRTAYVEAVVTDAALQGRGIATAVMRRLHDSIQDFALGGLSPARYGLYERLGWERWRGPLAVREDGGLVATPDDKVMILRLSGTPALDLDAPLSVEWRAGELW